MMCFPRTLIIYIAAHSLALAQVAEVADATEDTRTKDEPNPETFYSERARLGNQRTQTEAAIKAREEQLRLEEAERQRQQAEQERQAAQESAGRSEGSISRSPVTPPSDAGRSVDMSRTLEQLRTLGELKDDGYITEAEFSEIKRRILNNQE